MTWLKMFVCSIMIPSLCFGNEVTFSNIEEKVSYIIGRNIGDRLIEDNVEVQMKHLVIGLQEAYKGKASEISSEEAQNILNEYHTTLQKKEDELTATRAKEQATKSALYLTKNSKRKGVTTTKSGIQYEIIQNGTGKKPTNSDYVTAHWHGTLVEGLVFDSTVERGVPGDFRIDQVIPGLSEPLKLMTVGSKWKVFVPPNLGYAEQGSGDLVGPNAVLIYELELLSIRKPVSEESEGTSKE